MKNLLIVLCILLLLSCSTTRTIEVPVETIKKEYIYDTKIDSIIIRDSIDRWYRNDTTYIYKEKVSFKYKTRIDTIIRTDTIPKILTIEKEVKVNKVYWYQKLLMWAGSLSLMLLILYLYNKFKLK
nr:MAG TPA: TRAF PROTEIN, TRAO PROTEIN, TRAN ADHESION, BACTERIAL SECRETION.5A [Bacteriophage sp.]